MKILEAIDALIKGDKLTKSDWGDYYIYLDKNGFIRDNVGEITSIDKLDNNFVYYKPKHLLDDVEKEYLINILKPFLNDKYKCYAVLRKNFFERYNVNLQIEINNLETGKIDIITLPSFRKGNMYKNLNINSKYDEKELELC